MRFTDIVDAIKVCSPDLRKTDIVDGLLHPIADGFKLRNQKGNKFDFLQSNRVSELLTSDKIPECLILTFKQPSFTKVITQAVDEFIDSYNQYIKLDSAFENLCQLCKRVSSIYKGNDNDRLRKALVDCLNDYFSQKYNALNMKVNPSTIKPVNTSLFVTLIEGVLNVNDSANMPKRSLKEYKLEQKLDLNKINGVLREKIESYADNYYDKIEVALHQLSLKDLNIINRFLLKMGNLYMEFREEYNIPSSNHNLIIQNAQAILDYIKMKILSSVANTPIEKAYDEDLDDYAFALVVYAFYECKILIPMEDEK